MPLVSFAFDEGRNSLVKRVTNCTNKDELVQTLGIPDENQKELAVEILKESMNMQGMLASNGNSNYSYEFLEEIFLDGSWRYLS